MNECEECIEQLKPSDPRVPFYLKASRLREGHYLKPICYYCNNYAPSIQKPQEVKEEQWARRQWDVVQQLRAGFEHVHKEVMECLQQMEKRQ